MGVVSGGKSLNFKGLKSFFKKVLAHIECGGYRLPHRLQRAAETRKELSMT